MIYISPRYGTVALLVSVAVYILIAFVSPPRVWEDVSQAVIYHQVRKYLLHLNVRNHVKYWRPSILLLVSNPRSCYPVIDLMNSLKKGGLYMIGTVVESKRDLYELKSLWNDFIEAAPVKVFSAIVASSSIAEGAQNIIRTAGVGAFVPNTVAVGFYEDDAPKEGVVHHALRTEERTAVRAALQKFPKLRRPFVEHRFAPEEYMQTLRTILHCKKNLLVTRNFGDFDKNKVKEHGSTGSWFLPKMAKNKMHIDMWPVSLFYKQEDTLQDDEENEVDVNEGEMNEDSESSSIESDASSYSFKQIILYGYILRLTSLWDKHARLRVRSYAYDDKTRAQEEVTLSEFMHLARVNADLDILSLSYVPDSLPMSFASAEGHEVAEGGSASTRSFSKQISKLIGKLDENNMKLRDRCRLLNVLMRQNTQDTAIVFCPLPELPDDPRDDREWLESVRILTENLPPTILVRGVENVISYMI
eukprot:TRINITY_DN998_c0_g2_i1.p1 TRINITY_DN998_c0_g2~~TRINITY_DN998_c0_g2_i1.p1  ORF type:complete len:473 (+),score=76.31 TRINITY_DN998_c0_g2_i1:454-1872(+)